MRRLRQVNLPNGMVGKLRQAIYTSGFLQIKKALEAGFYVEVIALSESVIADRLEARWAWKNGQSSKAREFGTLGFMTARLMKSETEPRDACLVYERAAVWSKDRNRALHEMLKLPEGEFEPWEQRYAGLEAVAKTGVRIARQTDNVVRRLNRPARQ